MKLKSYTKIIILLVIILSIIFATYYFNPNIFLEKIKYHNVTLLMFINKHYLLSVTLYMLTIGLSTFFGIPFGILLSMAGGFFFGSFLGTIYAITGSTIGATAIFLLIRYFLYDTVNIRYGKRIKGLQETLSKRGTSYILALHFIPATPFFFINILAGLSKIPVGTFIAATAVGLIPGTWIYTLIGRKLGIIESLSDLLSPTIITLFVILALLALIPPLLDYITGKRKPKS